MAFAEVVGAGCKQLALSSPYSNEYAGEMMAATEYAAKEYKVVLHVENDLLVSKLFPADVAKNKTVILIARNQSVLDKYAALKALKKESNDKGNPDEIEFEIARRFGKLLSYDDDSIERLLSKHG
jgi:hypothetical protein